MLKPNKIETGDLSAAIRRNQPKVVEELLRNGADFNETDEFGRDALSQAAFYGYADMVRTLLDRGADIHKTCRGGMTPLMDAACRGHTETVRLFIERGARIDAADNLGLTALMMSVYQHRDVLRLLLDKGADVSLRNKAGDTALSLAERGNKPWMVQQLREEPFRRDQINSAVARQKQERLNRFAGNHIKIKRPQL